MIHIDIWYKLQSAIEEIHVTLDPAEYFDPLEVGESYSQNGIPKHNFTWQYLSVPRRELVWTIERRMGVRDSTTFSTQYFDGGQSWLNHRTDPSGFEELIHAFDFGDRYLTIRSSKQPSGRWTCTTADLRVADTDKLIYTLPDGTFDTAAELSRRLEKASSAPHGELRPNRQSHNGG